MPAATRALGAVALLTVAVAADKYTICDHTKPLIRVDDVQIGKIHPGQPLQVKFAGTPTVDIPADDMQVEVSVSVLGFKLGHADLDFCTELPGVKCPIAAGESFSGTLSYTIPEEAPPGIEVETRIEVKDTHSDLQYSCVEVKVKVEAMLGAHYSTQMPAITPTLVHNVNSADTSWAAHMSPRFEHYTVEDAQRIAGGTVMNGQKNYMPLPARKYRTSNTLTTTHSGAVGGAAGDIPAEFDAREAWPECAAVIGRIRDQSDCGACWAFASTEAFNDRRCIKSLQQQQQQQQHTQQASDKTTTTSSTVSLALALARRVLVGGGDMSAAATVEPTGDMMTVLSAEDTLACCHGLSCGLSMGCNGGQPSAAWRWFTRRGVVSGLDYADMHSGTSCKPYEFQPCAHHVPASEGLPDCPAGSEYPTPSCVNECSDASYSTPFDADKRFASSAYSLRSVADIQRDLLQHGPVTAAFSVYSDFLAYAGGVYEHVTGFYAGGHAVKILGWGTDAASGKDYWLVANSWNNTWGEKGLFKILRGENHCGIEGQIVAGEA